MHPLLARTLPPAGPGLARRTMAAEPVLQRVGVLEAGRFLSPLAQAVALALDGHASSPRTVAIHAAAGGVPEFLASDDAVASKIVAASTAQELCTQLEAPRCVLVFGASGASAEAAVRELLPFLQPGDVVVDAASGAAAAAAAAAGGLAEEPADGVQLLRCGFPGSLRRVIDGASIVVSGGDAACGAGIAAEVLEQLAAFDGRAACVTRVGGGVAAHLTQQVHDSLELCMLSLLSEACHLLSVGLRMSPLEVAVRDFHPKERCFSY